MGVPLPEFLMTLYEETGAEEPTDDNYSVLFMIHLSGLDADAPWEEISFTVNRSDLTFDAIWELAPEQPVFILDTLADQYVQLVIDEDELSEAEHDAIIRQTRRILMAAVIYLSSRLSLWLLGDEFVSRFIATGVTVSPTFTNEAVQKLNALAVWIMRRVLINFRFNNVTFNEMEIDLWDAVEARVDETHREMPIVDQIRLLSTTLLSRESNAIYANL